MSLTCSEALAVLVREGLAPEGVGDSVAADAVVDGETVAVAVCVGGVLRVRVPEGVGRVRVQEALRVFVGGGGSECVLVPPEAVPVSESDPE